MLESLIIFTSIVIEKSAPIIDITEDSGFAHEDSNSANRALQ